MSRVSLKEIETYCDMVISAGLTIPWSVYASRIEPLLTPSCVAKLRKAGLYQIVLGVESFSSAVQKDMGKSANHELTDRVIRMFVDVGVATRIFLIYGYPTETDEDFEITCCWLEENGHLLSSIWVNSFILNDVYQAARPNRAHFESPNPWVEGGRPWAWSSEHSTLENRKERFFRLLEIGQRMRLRNPATTYSIGDPYMVKYFTEWSPSDLQYLQERWAKLEGR
jgi:radical SAM superfamily enzyme YgiQ (UPF0313 family)